LVNSIKIKSLEDPLYNRGEGNSKISIDRELLHQLYIVENLSIPKISKILNCSEKLVWTNLKTHKIEKNKEIWRDQLISNPKKVVIQYDLSGNFIKEWSSLKDAKLAYGTSVSNCCRGKSKISHGYIWRYLDSPIEMNLDNSKDSKSRGVKKYNLEGELVSEFKSLKEAYLSGFNSNNIQDCCVGRLKSHGGFIWRYSEDSPPQKYSNKTIKIVDQYSIGGEFIKRWDSIAQASKELGIGSNCIITCCKGGYKSGGFIWKYFQ